MDHLARGDGDILAEPEGGRIGVGELAALQIGEQMGKALDQALALGGRRLRQRLRIGGEEIGGAERVQHDIGKEAQLR